MLTYSTHAVPSAAKVTHWNEVISDVFAPLETRPNNAGDFDAEVRCVEYGRLRLANATSRAATVKRTKSQAAKITDHRFFLHVQMGGSLLIRQDGHEALLEEGDLVLSDSTLPYTLSYNDACSTLVLIVSQAELRRHLPTPEEMIGVKLSGRKGLSRTTSQMLRSVWEQAAGEGLTSELGSRIVDNLLDVFADLLRRGERRGDLGSRRRRQPPGPDQALYRGQSARSRAQRALGRGGVRHLAALPAHPLRQRAGDGVELRAPAAAGGMRTAAQRRAVAPAHDHRDRLRLGLQQRDAFRARVPQPLRHQPRDYRNSRTPTGGSMEPWLAKAS